MNKILHKELEKSHPIHTGTTEDQDVRRKNWKSRNQEYRR